MSDELKLERAIQKMKERVEVEQNFTDSACEWLKSHSTIAGWVCNKDRPLSKKRIEAEINEAILAQDYAYYALLLYQETIQEKNE